MNSQQSLDLDTLYACRDKYQTIPKDLIKFVDRIKGIQLKNKKINGQNWKRNTTKSKTSWLVTKKFSQDDDEKLASQCRGILNKISDSNFDEMLDELLNLDILALDQLKIFIDILFKKAIIEINYSHLYAKLCYNFFHRYVQDEDGNKIYFRTLFLTKCQNMFENILKIDTKVHLEQSYFKSKHEIVGMIVFLGHLYNHKLLIDSIIYNCIMALITKINERHWCAIECVCKLFDNVIDKFSLTSPNNYSDLCDILKKMSNDSNIVIKDRFMIMDSLDKIRQ